MGAERAAHHALERAQLIAHERDLLYLREPEVERLEQMPECLRVLGRELVQQAQHGLRARLVAVFARERPEPQQAVGRARVAGGDRVVLEVLAAGHQLLVVGRRLEEAAVLVVGEALDHRVGQRARLGEPARSKLAS